jgi:hypothetical protein
LLAAKRLHLPQIQHASRTWQQHEHVLPAQRFPEDVLQYSTRCTCYTRAKYLTRCTCTPESHTLLSNAPLVVAATTGVGG